MVVGYLLPDVVRLLEIGIEFVPTTAIIGRAARLAVEVTHSVYDCLYLVVAREHGARLATGDRLLRRAAGRLDIALWEGRAVGSWPINRATSAGAPDCAGCRRARG